MEPGQDVSSITELSEKDVAALRTHAQLLQTFHHRNKNQHRRSPWWRHFDHLRRDTKAFLSEVEGARASSVFKDRSNVINYKSKTKGGDEKVPIAERMQALKFERERVEVRRKKYAAGMQQRRMSWLHFLVITWYRSFSQLTADPQFAAMGLFLIASLSKVCGILDIMPGRDEADKTPPRALDSEGSRKANQSVLQDMHSDTEGDLDDLELDVGVRIERASSKDDMAEVAPYLPLYQEIFSDEQAKSRPRQPPPKRIASKLMAGKGKASLPVVPFGETGAENNSKTTTGLKRKDGPAKSKGSSKKSKKSSNAIDDLFSGLF